MEVFASLFKKEHRVELFLAILLIIYLVLGLKTPEPVANLVDTLIGKVTIFIVIVYLFMNFHPVLAVLALFAGFDLIRRASVITGIDALQKFVPTEEKKSSQFTAFNQFPYTLEQEVVAKMAPIGCSGSSITKASYKPIVEDLHNATTLNSMN